MPSAEIITIGTELLLGEIVDTNSQYLAKALREAGIDLYRITTVGDNVQRIAQSIKEALDRGEIVITTGGLGPTVDDPTRDAVALAAGVESTYHSELWDQIQARFNKLGRIPTENNRRQAYIPGGALAIENEVGTAPVFIVQLPHGLIISLPGVPSEMKHVLHHKIIPYLHQHYQLHSVIKTRLLHTAGVGESQIDDSIGDLEQLNNPTVGLAAHSGQVDVRITVKAGSDAEADAIISPLEATLRERLGDSIYGVDQDTLERVALQAVAARGWSLVAVESGLGGNLVKRLVAVEGAFIGGQVLSEFTTLDRLALQTEAYRHYRQAQVGLGVAVQPDGGRFDVFQVLITPDDTVRYTRPYGGPPEYAPLWAFNQTMDLLRRIPYDS
jgi:nicotinamide-nucleotide amidase